MRLYLTGMPYGVQNWHKDGLLSPDTARASCELSYFSQHKDQEFAKAISECISAVVDGYPERVGEVREWPNRSGFP
jgi:hypothetical protein